MDLLPGTVSGSGTTGPPPSSTSPLARALTRKVLRSLLGETAEPELIDEPRDRLPASCGIVGFHTGSIPTPEPVHLLHRPAIARPLWIGRVDQHSEMRREDDSGTVDGDTHCTVAAITGLEWETL